MLSYAIVTRHKQRQPRVRACVRACTHFLPQTEQRQWLFQWRTFIRKAGSCQVKFFYFPEKSGWMDGHEKCLTDGNFVTCPCW